MSQTSFTQSLFTVLSVATYVSFLMSSSRVVMINAALPSTTEKSFPKMWMSVSAVMAYTPSLVRL